MITFIKNIFNKKENTTITEEVVMSERAMMKSTSLTYHYLEMYVSALPTSYSYDVREELKSGTIITHCVNVSHEEMKDYVRKVYIESHPPKFVITATMEVY